MNLYTSDITKLDNDHYVFYYLYSYYGKEGKMEAMTHLSLAEAQRAQKELIAKHEDFIKKCWTRYATEGDLEVSEKINMLLFGE